MCEKCLYNKNCQFLAKHNKHKVEGCTAFKSEVDFKQEVAREIFEDIEGNLVNANFITGNVELNFAYYLMLKKKYTESEDKG